MVEGLTEFLPVSSTGHLIIAGHLLGFVGERADSFEVIIQLGAILSVVLLYWRRFVRLIPVRRRITLGVRSTLDGWSGVWRVGLATAPALIVGYAVRHVIKERLFNPGSVTFALAAGGGAIPLGGRSVGPPRAPPVRQRSRHAYGEPGARHRTVSGLVALARHIARRRDDRRRHAARTRPQERRGIFLSDRRAGHVRGDRLRDAQAARSNGRRRRFSARRRICRCFFCRVDRGEGTGELSSARQAHALCLVPHRGGAGFLFSYPRSDLLRATRYLCSWRCLIQANI